MRSKIDPVSGYQKIDLSIPPRFCLHDCPLKYSDATGFLRIYCISLSRMLQ